jgi:hypothetical protein
MVDPTVFLLECHLLVLLLSQKEGNDTRSPHAVSCRTVLSQERIELD